MTAPDVLVEIARNRAARVKRSGAHQGVHLPAGRDLPVTPLLSRGPGDPILIAEVKRRSPSRGSIAEIPDPAALAGSYREAGFRRVSVLTEEERFGGSLSDLLAVKEAHPELALLRKDFLLTLEDVDISWRAGADAILLIATLLDPETLEAMYRRAVELGLSALVEVHDAADVDAVRSLRPPLIGINSRDLRRFVIEPLVPLETRTSIDWSCAVIYESGVSSEKDALFVRGTGFDGLLVGEAVARSPGLARRIVAAWDGPGDEAVRRYGAWSRLYASYRPGAPFVKVCGITNREDAEAAVAAGADLLGFVFAPSPRQVTAEVVRECVDLDVLRAAVVVLGAGEPLPDEISSLVRKGALDFIQFHGDESPEMVASWPGYKALRPASVDEVARIDGAGSPAVLIDAFAADARGGTGRRIDEEVLTAAAARRRPWIAGGLNPENVSAVVRTWRPGLVDVSSGVERERGKKDHARVRAFVHNAKEAFNEQ